MNNKTLLGIFGLLLAIFLASKIFGGGNKKSNFNPEVVLVDTSMVDQILITPKAGAGDAFSLHRNGSSWDAKQGDRTVPAVGSAVASFLDKLVNVTSKRIVSKSPDKWSVYEVEEGAATRIQAKAGNKSLADFLVGGFKFDQATRSASSYMRRTNENDVYLVDGFLSMNFNQSFDNFRNKEVLKLNTADATKLTMNTNGSQRGIQKLEDGWYFSGMEKLDSAVVAQYLSSLSNVSGGVFVDDFNPAGSTSNNQMIIEANNIIQPITITSYNYANDETPYVIHSSLNPDAYFSSDSSGIYQKIFSKFEAFMPN